MSNILSAIDDDYDDYVKYCAEKGEQPKGFYDSFYDHWEKLRKKDNPQ